MLRGFFSMRLSDFVISKMMQQPDRPQLNQLIKDDVTPSLHLKVGLNVASWHFIGTVKGIRVRQALGKHPTITTEEARRLALKVLTGELIDQVTGKGVKVAPFIMPTFGAILDSYTIHRKLKARTAKDYRDLINKFSYSDKTIDLTAESFNKHYQQIHQNTPTQARYLARVIKALQRWATDYLNITIDDATKQVKALTGEAISKTNARERRLDKDQLSTFWRVLNGYDQLQSDAVTFALLTGLRRGEINQITAESILHRENMVILTISDTKNGTPQNLPLVGIASAIIQRRITATTESNVPLFPTNSRGLFRALSRKGIPLSWHDLRRSWASFAVNAGVSEAIIKRVLNHSTAGNVTTRHYARIDLTTIADALLRVEAVIFNK